MTTARAGVPAQGVHERRPFGATDLRVSPIGVGCARIGGVFQREAGSFIKLLDEAVDAGINFFDTADMYSQGESESLLGRALKGRRERVVIASKVGYVLPAQRRLIARIKPLVRPVIRLLGLKRVHVPAAVRGEPSQDFSPKYVRRAIEASLRRLRTDRIDLLQLHSPPISVIRRGDWASELDRIRREGKIRYYGVACDTAEDALAAMDQPGVASVQVTLNLLERTAAGEVLSKAREKGIAVIARECLANGLLAKDARDIDPSQAFRSKEEADLRMAELARHRDFAKAHGVELPAFAMKYVLAQPGVSVALVGLRTPAHLDGALRWLSAPDVPLESVPGA